MGFSIGGLVSGAAKAVGSVLSRTTDPLLQIGGAALTGAFAAPAPSGSISVTPTVLQPARLGVGSAVGLFVGGAGIVAELLRMSRSFTGRPVNAKKIRASVQFCGISVTAETFGLTESQICTIALSARKRRSRGISAADLRRTRSTIRKVTNISKSLKSLGAGRK